MTRAPAQPNQSLRNALECLLQLCSTGRPVGSREMARELGMEHTRVNRLLGTLAALGLAERTSDRKYAPGPGVHVLAAMSLRGSPLLSTALPHIRGLIKDTGYRVALGVLWRTQVCYLYHGGPRKPLEAAIAGHELYPAAQSCIGLPLLASLKVSEVRALYRGTPVSPWTSGEVTRLLRELSTVRREGYALCGSTDAADSRDWVYPWVNRPGPVWLSSADSRRKRSGPR